ncbi:hypothetical protein PINS_up001400 [Pythium insidiosum]|nr:hypothetical protein PINS_up001400 [Pythium insidiosum]
MDEQGGNFIELLPGHATRSLRAYIESACEALDSAYQAGNPTASGDIAVEALRLAVHNEKDAELTWLLNETVVLHYYSASTEFPRGRWSTGCSLTQNELVAVAIQRLLYRKRVDPDDSNVLTLGYREVSPGPAGHRVAHMNGVMSYFPNTLVTMLQRPVWEALHQHIGDDLLLHLLLNFSLFIRVHAASPTYVQLSGRSYRWMPTKQLLSKKRKRESVVAASTCDSTPLSINQVLYTRTIHRRRIYPASHPLINGSNRDELDQPSRGAATRVIHKIFPKIACKKRLPKRFIRLVPIIQQLLDRTQRCDVDKLVIKLLPIPRDLVTLVRDDPEIREIIRRQQQYGFKDPAQSLLPPVTLRAMDDGYLSQQETPDALVRRQQERLDVAATSLSDVSAAMDRPRPSSKRRRLLKLGVIKQEPASSSSDQVTSRLEVATSNQLVQLQRHRPQLATLMQLSVTKQRVYRIARKTVAALVPKEIWGKGASFNWQHVKSLVRDLVFSQKFDVVSVERTADRLKVKDIEWMDASGRSTCPPNELKARRELITQLLRWCVETIVFPLLRSAFYVTEIEGSGNDIAFYQRAVWNVISSLALHDLSAGLLSPLRPHAEAALVNRQLATSRLRLLPKVNGIRPLMNLSSVAPCSSPSSQAVNRSLELVHRALLFEIERQKERVLGSTVRNLDEIHSRLKPFLHRVRACSRCRAVSSGVPVLYGVTVDVERCFDTINPEKLFRMLRKLFLDDEYLVRKHWVCRNRNFKMERDAFPAGSLQCFDELLQEKITVNKGEYGCPTVYVDGVVYNYISKSTILKLLKEHLHHNVIKVEDQELVQVQGIPQGSVLSTTLCNLYYAHFERRVLQKQLKVETRDRCDCSGHELLMRYTDDFLFLSTCRDEAARFAYIMHQGHSEYGCSVNWSKSRVNFDVFVPAVCDGEQRLTQIPRVDRAPFDGVFPWCGLLIDPMTLQLYVNYDRLSLSVVAASLPIDDTKPLGCVLVHKVLAAVRQRWHPIFVDADILTPTTVQINVFQVQLLTAVRFVLFASLLPVKTLQSAGFLHRCVRQLLNKVARGVQRAQGRVCGHGGLSRDDVVHLGLHCFLMVLDSLLKAGEQRQKKQGDAVILAHRRTRQHHKPSRDCDSGDTVVWRALRATLQTDQRNRATAAAHVINIDPSRLQHHQRNAALVREWLRLG